MLKVVHETLKVFDRQRLVISPDQAEIKEAINDPSIDTTHKLKLSIPIIPLLLDYETELELEAGFNLKALWQQLKNRFQKS